MSFISPSKFGPVPHRPDAGLIQFIDGIEDPAQPDEAEQITQARDRLLQERQAFDRARGAFERQAEAEASRLAELRRKLVACRDELLAAIDRCLAGDARPENVLSEVRDALQRIT